jgi:hypothetical protein
MEAKTQILDRYNAADDYLSQKRDLWTEYENLFNGRLQDRLSLNRKSQVFDHKLSTLILDREARVMSQLPTGKVRGISKNDEATAHLMNLSLEKYVIPNANSQFDFLTKLRLMDRYSNIYGNMFSLVDWSIRGKYAGPDLWLLPIRDVFPQVGAVSVEESDYIVIRYWKPLSYFESLRGNKEYKNIGSIIETLKKIGGSKESRSSNEKTARENTAYPSEQSSKNDGYFPVLCMYEKDKWSEYVLDADEMLRDYKNPHEDDELPILNKTSIPMLDDIMGTGDMERGMTMQKANNSLWNMYMDAVKISIFPPGIYNKDQIIASTIKWGAAEKWLVKGNTQTAFTPVITNPQGLQTFQAVKGMVDASILNMMGTTDTSVNQATDQAFGRTPQALQMQAQRENARDNVDRFYMEQYVSKVYKKMTNLLSKKQSGSLQIRMFKDEIQDIRDQYPESEFDYNENTGKLTIKKSQTGSTMWDYEMVTGSTFVKDQSKQLENLTQLFSQLTQNMQQDPQTGGTTSPMIQMLKAEGIEAKPGQMFKKIVALSGINDWDSFIDDKGRDGSEENVLKAHQDEFIKQVQNMQNEDQGQSPQVMSPQGVPPQGMPPQGAPMQGQMPQGQPIPPQMSQPMNPQQLPMTQPRPYGQ